MSEQHTFDEIYRSHAPEIFRFVLGLTRNHALAEDLTAETFARALTTHHRGQVQTVRAYLFTIAHRLVVDHVRRRRAVALDDIPEPSAEAGFAELQEHRDLLEQTLRFLGQLPDLDRQAVLMRAADLSYSEIAAALGTTEQNARVRVHRVRLKLALWRADNS